MSVISGRWLLVEKEDGSLGVANVRTLVNNEGELKVGQVVTISNRGGTTSKVTLVSANDDRKSVLGELAKIELAKAKTEEENKMAEGEAPAPPQKEKHDQEVKDEEIGDFSPSGSSWGPDGEGSDSDSNYEEEVDNSKSKQGKMKMNGKSSLTPALRPEPVMPFPSNANKRKRARLTENSKTQNRGNGFAKIKNCLQQCEQMMRPIKNTVASIRMTLRGLSDSFYDTTQNDDEQNRTQNESMSDLMNADDIENKSGDRKIPVQIIRPIRYGHIRRNPGKNGVQIIRSKKSPSTPNRVEHLKTSTPKSTYSKATSSKENKESSKENGAVRIGPNGVKQVPIGSGKTFISEDIMKKINWQSYTMATRRLLMGAFSREVLATHSLTGKASPAFADKPVKLRLDPQRVFDIILTVVEKCNVKEAFVRSAITTKCADENKMRRIQEKRAAQKANPGKKTVPLRIAIQNQSNVKNDPGSNESVPNNASNQNNTNEVDSQAD